MILAIILVIKYLIKNIKNCIYKIFQNSRLLLTLGNKLAEEIGASFATLSPNSGGISQMELFINFFELIFANDSLPDIYYFPTMVAENLLTPQNASTSISPAENRKRFVTNSLLVLIFVFFTFTSFPNLSSLFNPPSLYHSKLGLLPRYNTVISYNSLPGVKKSRLNKGSQNGRVLNINDIKDMYQRVDKFFLVLG